ncbi:NAD-dependent epimerase/dehydratase family protein [Amorphoplanes nipponensis]|uniref:NAD-dependent epimerase n=1 Tax=Actinoplanes nipponensis TaxID=135950 RepID=A0A919MK58_9ACTN|nr:SDR family oxidoreductase [Actinoplanes nipponensis]GIE47377.1 NAD-dependent epimerase [Actinoplanes nipponensis]
MEIVGRGFLAQHLAGIAGRHDGVVVLAAGVSAASGTSNAQFCREADLVARSLRRCAATGERLLFFSTASTGMYGALGRGREDEPVAPGTPYGQHKRRLEQVIADSPVEHLVVRLAHVAGPHQPPHQLLPSLLSQVMAGRVRLHEAARRDIIDVADVVALVDRLLATRASREVVNIATGFAVPVEALVDRIETVLGRRAERVRVTAPAVNHLVCTRKLHRLVPEAAGMGFGERYFEAVLDRYVSTAALV